MKAAVKVNSALEYYKRAGNHERIQLLLIELSKAGALAYDLFELKPYYMILTEDELMSHPNLVGGLSMLYSIMWKPEQSEYWYKSFAR